jgi:hypothetical protein
MRSYSDYYEKKLYPLQDGVLRCVEGCKADFFLTGGTALSRGYYGHRYSDDLDFFLCASEKFNVQVESVLSGLTAEGYRWDENKDFLRSADFFTLVVSSDRYPDSSLKLDFVNDVAPRFGEIVKTDIFNKTDSVRNILSNKLTALFRFEAKDVADLHAICLNFPFSWAAITEEARAKEAGVEAPLAAEILLGIPKSDFLAVRWDSVPSWEAFQADLSVMALDLARGNVNSLCAFSRRSSS